VTYFNPEVVSANDYYPFGSIEPYRTYTESNAANYRFGFDGQEKSDEIKGPGNSYTAAFWEYDPRIGRRWNIDPAIKPWESNYSTFSNNPIYRIDPLGNKDTTVGGKHSSTGGVLPEVVVKGRIPFSKEVLERIHFDARASVAVSGRLYLPGTYEAKVREIKDFTQKSVAESFREMLLLSRYQREQITVGKRLIGLINEDDNFKEFEKEALAAFSHGETEYRRGQTVLLGGNRGSLWGLIIPMPSSLQTLKVSTNELTWAFRNVYITATLVHGTSPSGHLMVEYSFRDYFDLVPGGRGAAYNITTTVLGGIYHGLLQNSGPQVDADWVKEY
jgi:RHS repeat-associated protein